MTTNKKPQGEVFEGRSAEMKVSPWLASEDLLGKEVAVEIVKVYRFKDVEFDAGRKEAVVYAMEFKGANKQLVLNSTNRKKLVQKFGPNVKDWTGKTVTLYVDENVRLMGKKVCGIRIK